MVAELNATAPYFSFTNSDMSPLYYEVVIGFISANAKWRAATTPAVRLECRQGTERRVHTSQEGSMGTWVHGGEVLQRKDLFKTIFSRKVSTETSKRPSRDSISSKSQATLVQLYLLLPNSGGSSISIKVGRWWEATCQLGNFSTSTD
mmetsp:Transcript_13213/g.18083  ORF Transcript_13213/g.18083 Transcript_13213/m.18083 type:complete len:148 (-) Transcript_13213:1361-1804(-)